MSDEVPKVGVLRHDDIVMVSRKGGDPGVIRLSQTKVVDVSRVGKGIGQSMHERWAEIFVEEQFHAGW
jgi:hypothetical protein